VNARKDGTAQDDRDDWRFRLLFPFALMLVSLLARTWRFSERNGDGWRRLSALRKGWILSLWHCTLLPMARWHRQQGMVVLVSEHHDGELIARVLHAWGYRTIRGSSTRGGGRALLAMIRELEQGSAVAVTPDGPQGPALKYQSGALVAAQRAAVPIVPVALRVDRAWRLKSWDRLIIPKPFARITVAYEMPTEIHATTSRAAAAEGERFEEAMRAAQVSADA
jgi:lysophospholipid acyltransferase (LPLAT)-like uncharacterized protein